MFKRGIVSLLFVCLVTRFAYAEIVCDTNVTKYHALYTLNNYTCQNGTFLPANTLGCRACPTGATCPGGEYYFNADTYNGLKLTRIVGVANNACANNLPPRWNAIFTPNVHTCSLGYYMPANTDDCVVCPANSYCPGGTYTFNETVSQGITPCPAGTVAPTGMWEFSQCGRIMHIGADSLYLRTTKKTTPALNFDIDGDGTPDYFANMSTADQPMNHSTTRKLKLSVNGITYSVCDDTVGN